ncbi:MAG: hypothetical protein KHW79_07720 [Clostridiales bacterium]|nr:hypothetical protein [Clostridiales bacterium]
MKKSFSRATGLFLVLTLIFSLCSLQTSAATYWNPISGTDKWVAMPGNEVNGSPKPSSISLGSNGLTIGYTGGEYVPGGSNAGVMYALPVDLKDFSVEFTVTKKAGDYNLQNTGVDSWISLCLLNKPTAYFNVNKAGQSQGIVTLIRPMGNTTAFEINQLTNSWGTASRRAYMFPGKMTTTFTVRIKKNSSGTYDYLVNGTKVDLTEDGGSDFTSAFTTLMEKGSVYFYMGVSSKDSAQQIEWRISKINGTAVKADSTATSSAAPNTSSVSKPSASVSSKSQTPTGNTSTGTTSNKPIESAGSINNRYRQHFSNLRNDRRHPNRIRSLPGRKHCKRNRRRAGQRFSGLGNRTDCGSRFSCRRCYGICRYQKEKSIISDLSHRKGRQREK